MKVRPPTSPEGKIADKFFSSVSSTLGNLYDRWSCEGGYEDINDYKAPFQKAATKYGATITKMTKRPFGFVFTINSVKFQAFMTSTKFGWKRLK